MKKLLGRLAAIRMVWKALTCPYDAPDSPWAFRNHSTARAWLADARGMWHSS